MGHSRPGPAGRRSNYVRYAPKATVGHKNAIGRGVVSGWSYDLSDTIRPRFQYCHYTEDVERGIATRFPLAVNGFVLPRSNALKATFDLNAAANNCVWFSGL